MRQYSIDGAAVFTGALGFSLALAWNDAAAAAVRDARLPRGELQRALLVTAAVVLVLYAASALPDAASEFAPGSGGAAAPAPAEQTAHRYIVARG